nr:Ger(x)C family spore germination protein [Bacillus sp. T3]
MKDVEEKNKHPILLFCILLTIVFLLSGCNREELDGMVILSAIGIDQIENDKVKLTLALIDTRPTEQQEAKGIHVYTSEGDTIFDAARALIDKVGKQPIWPYIKIVVLGQSVTKTNILPYLDFLNRNNAVQPNPYILLSKKDASDIIKAKVDFSSIPAVIIEKMLEQQGEVAFTPAIKLHQFTEMMLSPKRVGYLAIIDTVKKGKEEMPKIKNTGVIKDAKWVGNLNTQETRGLLWLKDEVKGGILVIPALQGTGKIGLEILDQTKLDIKPKFAHGSIQSINVELNCTVSIGEMLTEYTALNHKKIDEIKLIAEQVIKKKSLILSLEQKRCE